MSGDGTVLANWGGGEDDDHTFKLYDCSLQRILSYVEGIITGIVYSPLWRRMRAPSLDQHGVPILHTLAHSAAINALLGAVSACGDYVLDLAWMHGDVGILALGGDHLFLKAGLVCPWQSKRLVDIQGCERQVGTFRQASWCPDDTLVMLLGPHGVLIWCSKSEAVVAQFCACRMPQFPFASHTSCWLARCSSNYPAMLAILDVQHLGLLNVKTGQVVHKIRFPACERPRSLSWNNAGSSLMFSRGSSWYVACFSPDLRHVLGERIAHLLRNVREHAGTEPSPYDFPVAQDWRAMTLSRLHDGEPQASSCCCVGPSLSLCLLAQSDMHAYFDSAA